jgi:hypothetical protein
MIAPPSPDGPAALAARWREDAEVLRRYGAAGRARMLEHLADELERSAARTTTATVDLTTAAERSGFTRGHLRRLIRTGKLCATWNAAGEPVVSLADLPRKPGQSATDPHLARPFGRAAVAELLRSSKRA